MEYVWTGKEVPEGLGNSYYDLIVAKYKKTRESNPESNICVTFSVFNRLTRDYLRKKWLSTNLRKK